MQAVKPRARFSRSRSLCLWMVYAGAALGYGATLDAAIDGWRRDMLAWQTR